MAFTPPLGSTSPEVLLGNATRLDELVNGPAATVPDRAGEPLDSWRQIMALVAAAIVEVQNSITAIGLPFTTLAEAQAAADDGKIPEGAVTWVRSEDNNALASEYMNISGTIQATGRRMLSEEGTNSLINLIVGSFVRHENASDIIFQVVDLLGYRQFYALTSGEFGTKKTRIKPNGIELEQFSILVTDGDGGVYAQNFLGQRVTILDKNGVVAPSSLRAKKNGGFGTDAVALSAEGIAFNSGASGIQVSGPEYVKIRDILGQQKTIIDASGNPTWSGGSGITQQDKINILNAENLNYYSKVRSRYNSSIEGLVFALTLILEYGQSLRSHMQGFPALSGTPYANLGNLMLGDSTRPNNRTGAYFTPVGDPILNPLRAVVQTAIGAATMTPVEVAALPADASNEGEGGVAALNMFRALWLRHMNQLTDPTRSLVLANASVNGRTIEELSKGASPELYNRIREAVAKIKANAGEGKTFGIGAILFDQGQFNYTTAHGGGDTREGWKSLFLQLYSDILTDFCSGQNPPAVFMSQTGASYTSDTNELAIGMAQLDLVTADGNFYGSATTYQLPDKNGHLTSNGYRWRDMYDAKVMFRVLILGEGWEPLHCISALVTDNYSLLNYAVPYPPLQWGTPYVGRTATTYADRGYRATDDNGALPITAAEIAADTVVKLTFSRKAVGTVKIWYADKTSHNGNGCLKDSDPFLATENYVYTEGSGQWADENITELVGKPYPLENWAWAEVITVEPE